MAGIGAAELRLHALLALQRSRRRRAEKARRAEGSDGGKLARLRAATQKNVRQEKPAPLAKTLASIRVGEEPDGALRFKGRVLSPPPKRASAQNGQLSPALIARLRERMAPKLDRPRTAPARRPPSPRAAAADRPARGASGHRQGARPADAPAAGARARADVQPQRPGAGDPGCACAAGRRSAPGAADAAPERGAPARVSTGRPRSSPRTGRRAAGATSI